MLIPSATPDLNTETYTYDVLNRLDYSTRTNGPSIDYAYDAVGNLLKKDDFASSYSYTSPKPNAVSQVTLAAGGTRSYGYDQNGNRTHENGAQQIWYNAYNKPTRINRSGADLLFVYGADQMRYKQVNQTSGRTTLYIDKLYEKITTGTETQYRHFIEDIAVVTIAETQTTTQHQIGFTHRDRLGSAVAIADHKGNLKETHGFDPFGKPRLGNILDKSPATLQSSFTTRGFTDHEHLDDVQLIHMNGRAYDFNLGRFLSVDPVIQFTGNSQSINPYSYILNNPLAGTDPSGYTTCDGVEARTCSGSLGGPHATRFKEHASVDLSNLSTSDIASVEVMKGGGVVINTTGGSSYQVDSHKANVNNGKITGVSAVGGNGQETVDVGSQAARGQNSNNGTDVNGAKAVANGVTAYIGSQIGDAGIARDDYIKQSSLLDPSDEEGRSKIKQETRNKTPKIFKDIIEQQRPGTGPQAGTGGTANRTNAKVNKIAQIMKVGGKGIVGANVVINAADVVMSEDKSLALMRSATGIIGGVVGGAVGAIGGSFVAPGPGTAIGGIAGAAGGGYAGEKFGEWLHGKLFGRREDSY